MKIKKVLYVFLVVILILFSAKNYIVYADSLSVNMSTEKSEYARGQLVMVSVSMSNIDSSTGIYGLNGTLDYDTTVFEKIVSDGDGVSESFLAVDDFGSVTFNSSQNTFWFTDTKAIKTSQTVMKILLKVKDDAPIGETFIMLRDLQAGNLDGDISTSPATLTLDIKKAESSLPIASPTPSIPSSPTPVPTSIPTSINTPTPANANGGKLPQTGIEESPVLIIAGVIMVTTGIAYISYRRYKQF